MSKAALVFLGIGTIAIVGILCEEGPELEALIPIGIIGTREIQPPDQPYPKPFMPATIKFGQPIDVSRYRDRAGDRSLYRQLTDDLMYEIQHLCGLEYVDTYAGAPAEPVKVDVTAPEPAPVPVATIERRSSADVLKPKPLVGV